MTLPPFGRLTVESLMLPEPEAAQVPPPLPAQVQVQVSVAGNDVDVRIAYSDERLVEITAVANLPRCAE